MRETFAVDDNEEFELYERESYRSESHIVPDKPCALDFFCASAVSFFVVVLHWFWHYPSFHIALCRDFCVAAGLRPPETVSPGVWRVVIHHCLEFFPFERVASVLSVAGWVSSGISTFLMYFFLREILAVHNRQYDSFRLWRVWLAPAASAVGALLFQLSDPVWSAFDFLSPVSSGLLLEIASIFLVARYFRLGKSWRFFVAMLLFGLVAGDSILCLALTILVLFLLKFSESAVFDHNAEIAAVHNEPIPYALSCIFCFIGFMISSIVSAFSFSDFGGIDAGGYSSVMLPVLFLAKYVFSLFSFANIWGLLASAVVFIIPFALSVWFVRAELDDETNTSSGIPVILSVALLIAITQLAGFNLTWCWTWTGHVAVKSSEFLCVCILLSSCAVSLILAELFFRFCVRHFDDGENVVRANGKPAIFACTAVFLALALTVPGRYTGMRREMIAVIGEYVREVVFEAGDSGFFISNGALDDAVELEAYSKGRSIKAISMMSGQSAFEKSVRTRGAETEEENASMQAGAITILEQWKKDNPEKLRNVALQEGFVVWQREHEAIPSCSGVLARPGGFEPGIREKGIATTKKLASRIIALCEKSVFMISGDDYLNDKILYIMWNMLRMANLRAAEADKAGDYETAKAEIAFAEELERLHPSLKIIKEELIKTGRLMLKRLTPRQNLKLALESADFSSAKPFAEIVLKSTPDDPDANFAMAMYYMLQKVYSLSAEYLEKCVQVKPEQPAFLNNLSLSYLMLGQLEKAKIFADKAQAVYPQSPQIADTVRQVELAITNNASGK